MKGQFRINPCQHGQSRFLVSGSINQVRIRAYFRTQAEAELECQRRNNELRNFGHEIAAIPLSLRVEALGCQARLAPLKVSLTQAVDYYLAQEDWHSKSVPVSHAWAEFRSELDRRVAANEISDAHIKCMTKHCAKLVAAFGPKLICELSSDKLRQWLEGLPLSATSRNSVRINVSGLFTYARRRNWVEENPIAGVESFNTKRIMAKLPGILSPEQAAALLENAEPEILPHFAIGLFAGLRVSEIERLDWSDIDFEAKLIDVKAEIAKTAQPRWVPMSENLVAWLAPHSKAHGPVAPTSAKEYFIRRARKRAGIPDWPGNALRHSFCSYHLALHDDAALTAARAGHMDTKMIYRRYNNRVKKTVAQAYCAIAPLNAGNILQIA